MPVKKLFTLQLRPYVRALLDRAAEDQRRPRAGIIEEAIVAHLNGRYTDMSKRLDAMLRKVQA